MKMRWGRSNIKKSMHHLIRCFQEAERTSASSAREWVDEKELVEQESRLSRGPKRTNRPSIKTDMPWTSSKVDPRDDNPQPKLATSTVADPRDDNPQPKRHI